MTDSNMHDTDAEAFEDLFKLDMRVEATGAAMGRCNPTNDGCSNSCTSVGCSNTCRC
ncbi:MAG: FxLD family lanthipeptide [Stackebrandtia sp.]